jgi:succinoglycan biosynthesis protein ExoA
MTATRAAASRGPLPPLPEHPTVAVVIPARDAAGALAGAVGSALEQGVVDRVVVAVGPSADGTRRAADALAAAHPEVTVVDNPSGRTPAALNRAIAASGASVVVRLDAHAVLPPGYVDTALEDLRRTGAANVGGRQVPVGERGFARAVASAMASRIGAGGATYRVGDRAGPVDTVYLGVFRREALELVGGFDERFVRNQDAELNERLRRAGMQVWFDPRLGVRYRPRSTVGGLARQYWQYGRWRRATIREHPGSARVRQLLPPVLVAALTGSAVVGLAARRPVVPAAAVAGYLAVVTGGATAASERLRDAPATTLALCVMHLSWGAGFLRGVRYGANAGSSHGAH